MILYEGPSQIDGAPIVAIVTGLNKASSNTKTGEIAQVWILRADLSPTDAVRLGLDYSICGDCPHRGIIVDGKNINRSCYVTVFQAPLVVWKAFKRGLYQPGDAAAALDGQTVRIGAYGDPAAVPIAVWHNALARTAAVTGYTHQWRQFPEYAAYCMASCDSVEDYRLAKLAGWRTFRVRAAHERLLDKSEVACPASTEMGNKTTCALCRACGGASSKARVDIAIMAHGAPSKLNAFNERIAA